MSDLTTSATESGALPEAARGDQRVVVRSIGTSPAAVTNALRGFAGGGSSEATRLLLQAPSILVEGVSETFGQQLATILREAGLEVGVEDNDAPFEPGVGDHEVALTLRNPARLREVAGAISGFLGCDVNKAAQLAWASPALLIGKVSAATVDALRARFEPLEVEVDASRTADATYDVYLGADDDSSRIVVVQALRDLGIRATETGPLLATGLNRTQADRLWDRAGRRAPIRLLDHAFQRFDIRLLSAPDTPAVREHLMATTGMPERIVPKLLGSLPTVLHESVRYDDAPRLLQELDALGAKAEARLVTFMAFDLVVTSVKDPRAALAVMQAFVEDDGLMGKLQRPPVPIAGPFTLTRARWMQRELESVGVKARLEERA